MTCEWCSTSCSIESERRSKRRKTNLSKSFSSPKEFPAPSVLRIRPGRPRKNNGLDITKHDHMNDRRKILKQTVHDSTTFPLYPVQQGKIWRKRCTFLVAASRYLLTRLIYSLYRPRLLPRPSLHYSCNTCVQKQSQSSQWEAMLKLLSGMQPPLLATSPECTGLNAGYPSRLVCPFLREDNADV